ncbi:alpha/beta hydrolase [Microbacterium sp. SSW1-59]|uniref:alpha/beta fold hydrolase n=1 Tax=Microbacterium xanthum TaxID=3079794 RepID=UPI002AD57F13|nr:alpha/beta hydrolase [Microbacterium sp. SSW1-59]MDZ8201367.1 alpha/beta hydrolase [Microbacterium sp. SSW1-59]
MLPRYVRERGTPPLVAEPARFRWRTVSVATGVGDLTARVSRRTGPVATVLLHGAAGTWTTWTPLAAYAEGSGRALTDVVAVDLPGWGDSAPLEESTTVADVSRAVAEVVVALGYEQAIVVGHSLGALVSLDVAAREPDTTLGAVLVSPTGAAALDASRRPLRGGMRLPGFAGMRATMRVLAALGPAGDAVVGAVAAAGLLPALARPLFAARVDPTVVAAFRSEIRPASFARVARAAAVYDEDAWRAIRCRVVSVRGPADVFASPGDDAAFAARIPRFTVHPVTGAAHFAHVERPDAVLDAIAEVRDGA